MSAASEHAALRCLSFSTGGSLHLVSGSELAEFSDDANPSLSLKELKEMRRTWQRTKRTSAYYRRKGREGGPGGQTKV